MGSTVNGISSCVNAAMEIGAMKVRFREIPGEFHFSPGQRLCARLQHSGASGRGLLGLIRSQLSFLISS